MTTPIPFRLYSFLWLLLLCLSACGDNIEERIFQERNQAQQAITALGQALDQQQLNNAVILKEYAKQLATEKPQYQSIAKQLALDATVQGPLYQSLRQRLQDSFELGHFHNRQAQFDEISNLKQAANPALFNDMLSDPINVLADLSQGTLARVNAIDATALVNAADNLGAGAQLIGNPSYGEWQVDNSGTSFWVWYGMYSMLDDLTDRRRVRYDHWSKSRKYSYYHDVGRYRYSSPTQIRRQEAVFTKQQSHQQRQGKIFKSPYAKTQTGASGLSSQSKQVPPPKTSSAQTFRSNYAKSSSSSSHRNSSSRTSRGVSRGK